MAPGRTVEIVDITVNGDRRKGVGRRMVARLVNNLKGIKPFPPSTVYAITRIDNRIAQLFYEGLGFRISGRLHDFYRDGEDACSALLYVLDI